MRGGSCSSCAGCRDRKALNSFLFVTGCKNQRKEYHRNFARHQMLMCWSYRACLRKRFVAGNTIAYSPPPEQTDRDHEVDRRRENDNKDILTHWCKNAFCPHGFLTQDWTFHQSTAEIELDLFDTIAAVVTPKSEGFCSKGYSLRGGCRGRLPTTFSAILIYGSHDKPPGGKQSNFTLTFHGCQGSHSKFSGCR